MKKTIILILFMLLTALLVGCWTKPEILDIDDDDEIVPLSVDMGRLIEFSYSFGSYFSGQWDYHIFEENGRVFINAEGSNGILLDTAGEVPESTLDEIMKIIDDNDIMSWNGFAKYNKNVPDGYGFGLTAEYERGKLSASGYMRYPRRYDSGHKALADYLEKLTDSTPLYIPAADDSVEYLIVRLDSGTSSTQKTSMSVNFDTTYVTYYNGDTTMRTTIGDLPVGTMDPQELSNLAIAYYTLHPLSINDLYKIDSSSSSMELVINEGQLKHTVYASDDTDSEAFNEIVKVLLSYFDLDASFLGSEDHLLEGWRSQFSYPIYMIYDRDLFGEIIINLPERTVIENGVEYTIDKQKAETFDKAMKAPPGWAHFRFLYQDYGIFGTDGRGDVDKGVNPIDVFESYNKDDYLWMWGSTRKRGDWLQLYGGTKYCEEWEYIVRAVDKLRFE